MTAKCIDKRRTFKWKYMLKCRDLCRQTAGHLSVFIWRII